MAQVKPNIDSFDALSKIFIQIEGKGLKIKEATYQNRRIEYCRGSDLLELIKNNLDFVKTLLKDFFEEQINESNYMQLIYSIFSKEMILVKLRKGSEDTRKHPKKLYDDRNTEKWEEEKFYCINVKRSEKQTYFWLIVAVSVVLLVCLFPIWPLELKLFIWWISLILLIFLTGIIVGRLMVYLLCYSFGYDIWIFPDLLNEKCGFFESFYKLISCDKRNDKWYQLIIRIILFFSSVYLIYYIYMNPETLDEGVAEFWRIYNDTLGWGNDKIINYHNGTAISIVGKHDEHLKRILEEGIDD